MSDTQPALTFGLGRLDDRPAATPGRARTWRAQAFAGLTWPRVGVFLLVAAAFSLSKPGSMLALTRDGALSDVARDLLTAFVLTGLRFGLVLLAVVAATNLGPPAGSKRIAWVVVALVAGQAAGTVLIGTVLPIVHPEHFLAGHLGPQEVAGARALRWLGITLTDLAVSGTVAAFWFYLKRDAEAIEAVDREAQRREEADREEAEARLSVMQAQIEPHFLFNTLASIRRLYETDAGAGRAMLQHLVRYLTASLPALRAERSTLGRELALALAYLEVQKARMGRRLAVDVDVPAALHEVEVPPMMLATLVENAVIHGLGPLPEGGRIGIEARARDGRLTLAVSDSGVGLREVWGAGIGLSNIQSRLHTAFGESAALCLANADGRGVVATIDLPVAHAAPERTA